MTQRTGLYGVGQEAEQFAARQLAQRGWLVIPMSEYTNNTGIKINAPMLLVPEGMTISPDLLAIKASQTIWIEVKDKTGPTYTWKYHCWEHGIDKPNIVEYKKIQDLSGKPVFLLIHENNSPKTPDLYLHSMSDIGSYRKMKADLEPSDLWLYILLDNALLYGNFRDGNPEMIDPRNPIGAGLYWPRNKMKEWQI
jgi:hypothetical protein